MKRLTSKRRIGIKEGYWSPAKKEELVQRLAKYEDTGLEPAEIQELVKNEDLERTKMSGKYTIQEAVVVIDENSNMVDWFDSWEDAELFVEDMGEE